MTYHAVSASLSVVPTAVMICPSRMSAMKTTPVRRTPSRSETRPPKKGSTQLGKEYTLYSRLKRNANESSEALPPSSSPTAVLFDTPSLKYVARLFSVAAGISYTK
jgi:hypothetical protein